MSFDRLFRPVYFHIGLSLLQCPYRSAESLLGASSESGLSWDHGADLLRADPVRLSWR